MYSHLVTWLLATMLTWQPVGRPSPWAELRTETPEQTTARYADLAEAAGRVAFDPQNDALFAGRRGRSKTAGLLVAISWLESGFYNQVTSRRGTEDRSDHGRSWCAGQVLIGRDGIVRATGEMAYLARFDPELWSGQELEADPVKCLTVVYRMARSSFAACKNGARLGVYSGEGCDAESAPKAMNRLRRGLMIRPLVDDDALVPRTEEALAFAGEPPPF